MLEREVGHYWLSDLVPIEPDLSLQGESTRRSFGIAVLFLLYVDLFRKLLEKDVGAAWQEYLAWRIDDETVFTRLRIWVCGENRLLSGGDAGELISRLNDVVFWDNGHQRDFLLVLARRWEDFPLPLRAQLESRLLKGPPRWEEEEDAHYLERGAWSSLSRIYWLNEQGCKFSVDFEADTLRLRALAPKWTPEYGDKAAVSTEARIGRVETDKQFEPLLSVPLSKVLNKATELAGRQHGRLVESDPFAGLASTRPIRAFSALTLSGKRGDYPEWAWRTFLNPESRKSDKPKLSALIAERVSRIPKDELAPLTYSVSEWLLRASHKLFGNYRNQFERTWGALISVLRVGPEHGRSSVVRGNKAPDWVMEALNSPVGKLAEALMNDPEKDNLQIGGRFPRSWLSRAETRCFLRCLRKSCSPSAAPTARCQRRR
jgi:hypothetical protein